MTKKHYKAWKKLNPYNDDAIWRYIANYYEPVDSVPTILCKIGFHRYRGFNKIQTSAGGAKKFYGSCSRCGKKKEGRWQECCG